MGPVVVGVLTLCAGTTASRALHPARHEHPQLTRGHLSLKIMDSQEMAMRGFHVTCVLAFVLVVLASGCDRRPGSGGGAGGRAGAQEETAPLSAETEGRTRAALDPNLPVIPMSPTQLCDQAKDKEGAARRFASSAIELESVIASMFWADDGAAITLKVEGRPIEILCETVDREPWADYSRGQKVTVRGRWAGSDPLPTLTDCVVSSKETNPAVRATAEDLARQYRADPKGTTAKYRRSSFLLDGEVAGKETKGEMIVISLKASQASRIACEFPGTAKPLTDKVDIGAHLTVHGRFDRSADGKEVKLNSCLPVTGKR
jgi:hypothetical protein